GEVRPLVDGRVAMVVRNGDARRGLEDALHVKQRLAVGVSLQPELVGPVETCGVVGACARRCAERRRGGECCDDHGMTDRSRVKRSHSPASLSGWCCAALVASMELAPSEPAASSRLKKSRVSPLVSAPPTPNAASG